MSAFSRTRSSCFLKKKEDDQSAQTTPTPRTQLFSCQLTVVKDMLKLERTIERLGSKHPSNFQMDFLVISPLERDPDKERAKRVERLLFAKKRQVKGGSSIKAEVFCDRGLLQIFRGP